MFVRDIVTRIVDGCMELPRGYEVGVRIDRHKLLRRYSIKIVSLRSSVIHAAYKAYLKFPSLAKRAARKVLSVSKKLQLCFSLGKFEMKVL